MRLGLHVFAMTATGALFAGYHFYMMFQALGEDGINYLIFSTLLEWPGGCLTGGLLSVLALRFQIGWIKYLGIGIPMGAFIYCIAMFSCGNISLEPLNWIVGAASLPLASAIVLYVTE